MTRNTASLMKGMIHKILNLFGLSGFVKRIKGNLKGFKKYPNVWYFNMEGIQLKYDTFEGYSKKWFYPRYSNGRIHEPAATKLFFEYITKDSLVIDVGGHLGYFTCIAGKLASEGSVHVFEVDPKCINLIKKNLNVNEITNVTLNNSAVFSKNGKSKIPNLTEPTPGLSINSDLDDGYIEVDSITLDSFVTNSRIKPDFIKIDVEGAELEVLKGMKKLLAQERLTILVEIHVDKLLKRFNSDYRECIAMLIQNGFVLRKIEHRATQAPLQIIDKDTKLERNTMLLCIKTNLKVKLSE